MHNIKSPYFQLSQKVLKHGLMPIKSIEDSSETIKLWNYLIQGKTTTDLWIKSHYYPANILDGLPTSVGACDVSEEIRHGFPVMNPPYRLSKEHTHINGLNLVTL